MTKNKYSTLFVGFLVGLLFGSVVTFGIGRAYWSKQATILVSLVERSEQAAAENRAFQAYIRDSPEVAIFALSRYLELLKKVEAELDDNSVLITAKSINADLLFTHARLAKIYAENGQLELSADHTALALQHAGKEPEFEFITNQVTLATTLTRLDEGVKR